MDAESQPVAVTGPPRRPDVKRKLVVVGDGGCGKACAHDLPLQRVSDAWRY